MAERITDTVVLDGPGLRAGRGEGLCCERRPALGRNVAVLLATAAVSLRAGPVALACAGSER